MKIIVAITGASGSIYGIELLNSLKEKNVETHLIISEWGKKVIEMETGYSIKEVESLAFKTYDVKNLSASLSSSSFLVDAMIVVPATIKTCSEIANADCSNLISRAADNMLKMKRKLVVAFREMPLSVPALEQLYKLGAAGAIVLPLAPGFYHSPKTVDDQVKFIVGKCLDCIGIENSEFQRWEK